MGIDPFRLAIAVVPLAGYLFMLALVNLRRRPLLTSGSADLATLAGALSGLVLIGPIELFRPEAAVIEMGNFVWLMLLLFYWLWVWLLVLLSRPRLVIYNISAEELHPLLAEAASQLDPQARWAGDSLALPALGVQLHIDSFTIMRNVTLASSGGRQSLAGWRQLSAALAEKLATLRVQSNPRAVSFLLVAAILMAMTLTHLVSHPEAIAEAMREVFEY